MSGRTYGRLYVDIWADMKRHDLSRDARQLFPILIAQRKISSCGMLDLKLRQWAEHVMVDVEAIEAALNELDEIGWVAVDWETDELLLPGFIDHDIQPNNRNIILGAHRAAGRIESEWLRAKVEGLLPPIPEGKSEGKAPTDDNETTGLEQSSEGSLEGPSEGSLEGSLEGPIEAPGTLNPEPGALNPESSSPRTGSREPVDNPEDDDWITTDAHEWAVEHYEHRKDKIHHRKKFIDATARKIAELIREYPDTWRNIAGVQYPIDNPDLWNGDDLYGLGPPERSPLEHFHQRLAAAGLWSDT